MKNGISIAKNDGNNQKTKLSHTTFMWQNKSQKPILPNTSQNALNGRAAIPSGTKITVKSRSFYAKMQYTVCGTVVEYEKLLLSRNFRLIPGFGHQMLKARLNCGRVKIKHVYFSQRQKNKRPR